MVLFVNIFIALILFWAYAPGKTQWDNESNKRLFDPVDILQLLVAYSRLFFSDLISQGRMILLG